MTWEVIQGDAVSGLVGLPSGCVDSCVTDPPYGMNLKPQRDVTQPIANDVRSNAKDLWARFVPEVYRVAKNNTQHLFFGRWSEAWASDVLRQWFMLKGCIAWKKNVWGIGYYLRPQWELIWYCHKGTPTVPDEAVSDVWEFPRESAPIHSCQKPIELMRQAVQFACPEGGRVVDPFVGVGGTGVACVIEQRNFIGFEIEQQYVDVARARMLRAQGIGVDVPRIPRPERMMPLFEAVA